MSHHEDLIDAAMSGLAEGAVILRSSHSQNLRWANSAITTNGDMTSLNLTVVATDPVDGGTGVGVVSGQVTGPDEAQAMTQLAREAAASAPPSDRVDMPAGDRDPDVATPPQRLDESVTATMVNALAVFLDSPAAQFGYSESDRSTVFLATTSGTAHRHVQDSTRFEASARDATGSTWWGTNSWDAAFAQAAESQGRELALQQHTQQLPPGRYPVILTPGALADLMIYLAWSASARDALEGHNVFSQPGGGTRVGERLTPRDLTLFADPAYPGITSAPRVVVEANSSMESVFDNGLRLGRQDLIEGGVLTNLRSSRPTAQRFGVEPAYLTDNLILTDGAGQGSLADLVARTDDAVLVNCLWYIREVDPQNLLLTGLTRDGVYRVRDGQIVAGLPNFRFNVAVPDLLKHIVDASRTAQCLPREWADWFTRTAMPAVLVEDFNLSSASDAR